MPERTRRERFQIHLSTAIAMMFTVGALMWLNLHPRSAPAMGSVMKGQYNITTVPGGVTEADFLSGRYGGGLWLGSRDFDYGWPYRALHLLVAVEVKRDGDTEFRKIDSWAADTYKQVLFNGRRREWDSNSTVLNALIALTTVGFVAFVCEWQIRRGKVQKERN